MSAGRDGAVPEQQSELDELRSLLVPEGTEGTRLDRIEARLDSRRQRAADVGEVLAQAVSRAKEDQALGRALEQPVSDALEAAVKKDPQPVIDAIFPVIGPAIRKAIAHALRGMVQQFNQALEHSLSPRSLLWRLEARRTGRSFAEVVLLKTLRFKVEQVFLIHKENGLLLAHVTAPEVQARDADLVSAMLTAIQDFVRDSFQAGEDEAVQEMRVGDFSVWIEQGRHAVLAAVIRGDAPSGLRDSLQDALARIERARREDLEEFDGDASPFETSKPVLEACLQQERRPRRRDVVPVLVFLGMLFGVLYLGYLYFESMARQGRWARYVETLDEQPGIVVTRTGERDGRYLVRGLRDPLADDPKRFLDGIEADEFVAEWQPYHSVEPEIVLRRVRRRLKASPSVRLALAGGVLRATGEAAHVWVIHARSRAPYLPGIAAYDDSKLVDLDDRRFAALRARFEGGAVPATSLREELLELDALARTLGRTFRLELAGAGASVVRDRLADTGISISVANEDGPTLSFRIVTVSRTVTDR